MYGIDPGPRIQNVVFFDGTRVEKFSLTLDEIQQLSSNVPIACEWIEMMGKTVGKSIFETVHAIGYINAFFPHMRLIPRRDIKMHICQTMLAKDGNIRRALIDRYGEPGLKKNPGLFYGITRHHWQALAVAVVARDVVKTINEETYHWDSKSLD